MELLELLEELPLSSLVSQAKDMGHDAGMAHSREELTSAIMDDIHLRPNPITELRRRINVTIAANWDRFEGLMDRRCQECFLAGQNLCSDLKAIQHWMDVKDLYHSLEATNE